MNKSYICVYDSGIGGLTTLNEILKILPNENYLYFADDKNCPYGNKTNEEIQKLAYKNMNGLFKHYNIKMLVFACNTVTSCCVKHMRRLYNFDIVGIEPAVLPAVRNSKTKEILVILTNATKNQEKYKKLVERVEGKVYSLGLSDLAKEVECSKLTKKKIDINKYVTIINDFIKDKNVDGLVLGCTHYVYYKNKFKNLLNINVYDGNAGVSKRVKELLVKKDAINSSLQAGEVKILLSSRDKTKENQYKSILERLKLVE